jgi:hypothetical protein
MARAEAERGFEGWTKERPLRVGFRKRRGHKGLRERSEVLTSQRQPRNENSTVKLL